MMGNWPGFPDPRVQENRSKIVDQYGDKQELIEEHVFVTDFYHDLTCTCGWRQHLLYTESDDYMYTLAKEHALGQ